MSLHEPIIDTSMSTLADHALETSSKAMNRFSECEITNRISMNRRELENVASDIKAMMEDPQMVPLLLAEFVPLAVAFAEVGHALTELRDRRDTNVLRFGRK